MPKATVRRGKLTIPLSPEILAKVDVRDGDELEVTSEDGRGGTGICGGKNSPPRRRPSWNGT